MMNILLPFCVEISEDVFYEILKSDVWREKLDVSFVDALKSGMTNETLCFKSNDVLVDWKTSNSKSQRFHQYQLIGYWAMENYPTLGKKLFGESWKPLQRRSIEIIGSEAMPSDAVDAAIMSKLKLRSIELNVCEGTMSKLKHFVQTPTDIGKSNEITISRKIKSFDIEEEYIQNCWKALKYGNLLIRELRNQPDQNVTIETVDEGATSTSNDHHLSAAERLSRNGSQVINASEQQHIDKNAAKELTSSSFQTRLLEVRSENLTQRSNSAPQNQTNAKNIMEENDILKQQIKANAGLITSLQQGMDSSTKLNQMMEFALAEAEKAKSELLKRNVTLRSELNELKHFVSSSQKQSDQQIQFLNEQNLKIAQELRDQKEYIDSVEAPVQQKFVRRRLWVKLF